LKWIESLETKSSNAFEIKFIIAFIVIILVVNLVSIGFLQIFSYNVIKFLYSEILEKVLRSPIYLIFDNMNFSDLLKYFNKDLKIVHVILPSMVSQLIIIGTLIMFPLFAGAICISTLIPLVVLFIIINLF